MSAGSKSAGSVASSSKGVAEIKKGWMEEMVEAMSTVHKRVSTLEDDGQKVDKRVGKLMGAVMALQKRVEVLEQGKADEAAEEEEQTTDEKKQEQNY